jgi:acetolactate synthase-1/2/3 large subunit
VTTTGLGEMGFGLPGAVGASLALDKGPVVLITGDGSMMMNLQELQTIIHHRLPIKAFIYVNDGYLTIRNTQAGTFKDRFFATGSATGVSCPDFLRLGKAMGFTTFSIPKAKGADRTIAAALAAPGPVLCEVAIDPFQFVGPKLSFSVLPDGSLVSPPLEDLYPFTPREQLKREMLIGMHAKSLKI